MHRAEFELELRVARLCLFARAAADPLIDGAAHERSGPPEFAGGSSGACCIRKELGHGRTADVDGIAASPELERLLEMRQSGLARVDLLAGRCCGEVRGTGLDRARRSFPVPGGERRGLLCRDRQSDVQLVPLGRELELLDRLRVKLVSDGQRVALFDDEPAVDRIRDPFCGDTPVDGLCCEQRGAGSRPAGGGQQPDDAHPVQRQRVKARAENLFERIRQPQALERGRGDHELGSEQRVPAGTLHDRGHEAAGGGFAELRFDEACQILALQGRDRERLHAWVFAEGPCELAQRMTPMELVGLVGDEQAERQRSSDAQERGHERPCRGVCPMEILQGQENKAPVREALQHAEHAFRDSAAALLGGLRGGKRMVDAERIHPGAKFGDECRHVVARLPHDLAELGVGNLSERRPEGVGQGAIGNSGCGRVGTTACHNHSGQVRDPRLELIQQSRDSDPGWAG